MMVPGTGQEWFSGGMLNQVRMADVLAPIRDADVVTYRARESGRPYLDDALEVPAARDDDLYIVSWGPHIPELLTKLQGRRAAYWAESFGWDWTLDPAVPILAASRFLLGLWGERSPG